MTTLDVFAFIESASLEQCRDISAHLGNRLFALDKQYAGMKSANINEAAHLMADVLLDLSGAMNAEDEDKEEEEFDFERECGARP